MAGKARVGKHVGKGVGLGWVRAGRQARHTEEPPTTRSHKGWGGEGRSTARGLQAGNKCLQKGGGRRSRR